MLAKPLAIFFFSYFLMFMGASAPIFFLMFMSAFGLIFRLCVLGRVVVSCSIVKWVLGLVRVPRNCACLSPLAVASAMVCVLRVSWRGDSGAHPRELGASRADARDARGTQFRCGAYVRYSISFVGVLICAYISVVFTLS